MTNTTDPDERARELLADALNKNGVPKEVILLPTTKVLMQAATDAIVCALSHAAAVEGYVTVPKALTTDMLEAGEQELAMGNDFADAWEAAIDTMLGVPSFTPPPAPAAVAGGDAEEDAYVIDALAHLLAEISVIVNGPEPAGTKWSYHDLPAKVRALAAHHSACELGAMLAVAKEIRADAVHYSDEKLMAWAQRIETEVAFSRAGGAALQHRGDSRGGEG